MVNGGYHNNGLYSVVTMFGENMWISWRHPYILRLTFAAGLGALVVGYLTGIISIACFYALDDSQSIMRENVVLMTIVGGIFGAAIGGLMNDSLGRKVSLLIADGLIFLGATLMTISSWPLSVVVGTILVGLGVGMASMTAPIYVSEASPVRVRGALVGTNGFFIAVGQYLAYHINLDFSKAPRTWSLMLGILWLPALIQFMLLLTVPESPKWLSLKCPIVRRGLVAGVGLQVVQQFVGINTVMYYIPSILELEGNKKILSASLISYNWDIVSSYLNMIPIDKLGMRKPVLYTMCGIIACFFGLTVVFALAAGNSPEVSTLETSTNNFRNYTCSTYMSAPDASSWNCMTCLQASSGCGFCAIKGDMLKPSACLTARPSGGGQASCLGEGGKWFVRACLRERYGWWASLILFFYIRLYSLALGSIPIVVNSEIYPLKHRGICAGIAAVAKWLSYLLMISFFSFTMGLGTAYIFLLLGLVSCLALAYFDLFIPETRGLPLEPFVGGWLRRHVGSITW